MMYFKLFVKEMKYRLESMKDVFLLKLKLGRKQRNKTVKFNRLKLNKTPMKTQRSSDVIVMNSRSVNFGHNFKEANSCY